MEIEFNYNEIIKKAEMKLPSASGCRNLQFVVHIYPEKDIIDIMDMLGANRFVVLFRKKKFTINGDTLLIWVFHNLTLE